MGRNDYINVELVYASEKEQLLLRTIVVSGTTARDAIRNSELPSKFAAVNFAECSLGVWGKIVDETYRLKNGDRVEAYRNLCRDPRDARRKLALVGRSMGGSS